MNKYWILIYFGAVLALNADTLPTTTDYTIREDGNLLGRLNCSFEAGMRNSSSVVHSDDNQTHIVPGGTQGASCLQLSSGQRFMTEMVPLKPGDYTFSFDARAVSGEGALHASVMTSYAKDRKILRPDYGSATIHGLTDKWARQSFKVTVPPDAPGFVAIQIYSGQGKIEDTGDPSQIQSATSDAPVIQLDGLCLAKGDVSDFSPEAPVEIGLKAGNDHAWVFDGETLPVRLTVANIDAKPVHATVTAKMYDVLSGEMTLLPFPAQLDLDSAKSIELPADMKLPVGQYLVIARLQVGAEVVTDSIVLSVRAQHPQFKADANSDFLGHIQDNPEALDIAADLGWKSVRLHGKEYGILWPEIEPAKGQFDFTMADKEINRFTNAGIWMLGLFNYAAKNGAPSWLETVQPPKGAFGVSKPVAKNPADWQDYVRALVGRYKDRVHAWEVHNEPNGGMDAASYFEQLKSAYTAAKEVDPNCTIVGLCSTLDTVNWQQGDMLPFVRSVLEKGGGSYCDVISYHDYVWPHSPEAGGMIKAVQQLKELRDQYAPGKPLWDDEYGWCVTLLRPDRPRTERGGSNNYDPGVDFTTMDVANYCVRSHLIQLAGGVTRIAFFDSPEPHAVLPYRGTAITMFDYDGTPLPDYIAYREFIQRFTGAKFVGEMSLGQEAFLQVYQQPITGKSLVAVWKSGIAADPKSFVLKLPSAKGRLIDIFGRIRLESSDQIEIPVAESPYYVEVDSPDAQALFAAIKAQAPSP